MPGVVNVDRLQNHLNLHAIPMYRLKLNTNTHDMFRQSLSKGYCQRNYRSVPYAAASIQPQEAQPRYNDQKDHIN
jgi:hypothetical protein